MKLIKSIFLASGLIMALSGCVKDKFENSLQSPNGLVPGETREDYLLNNVQLNFASVYNSFNNRGMELTRMDILGGTYNTAYDATTSDGVWATAYTGVIKNADAVIATAAGKGLWYHVGMANVLKAYTYMMMVDNFGDIPFVEANQGETGVTNPKYTSSKQVYAGALVLLDSAILQLGRTPTTVVPIQDLYYASRTSWRTLARTLQLRAAMTTRLDDPAGSTTRINALLTANDLIDAANGSEDFNFKYGNRFLNPNTRHPNYNNGYRAAGGATGYIGNHFMWTMCFKKAQGSTFDPRTRYYFYRQNSFVYPSEDFISCYFSARPAHYSSYAGPYCFLPGGFWGRDHGDNSGIPPDNGLRTVWGVYPAGGRFQEVNSGGINNNSGARGAGILPIWNASFTEFLKAEAILTLGIAGDAKATLRTAVQRSIDKVMAFPASIGYSFNTANVPTTTAVTNYLNFIDGKYDATTTADEKMDLIGEEFYLALWGNGMEAYNFYRRTSRPKGMQPNLAANPGTFVRTFLYPSSSVNLNLNAQQKPNWGVKTFWDKNPDPLF